MGRFEWLLFLHVTGAFFMLGGSVAAGIFALLARRRERPSEVAILIGLTRGAVVSIYIGVVLTIVFGLWLVHNAGYGYARGWIGAAILLWLYSNVSGGIGGKREEETRKLAERLAAEGDAPSPELHARLHDRGQLVLLYSSGVAVLAILALMIWKPGQ
jgi:uncharacterized membrane protein